MPLESSTQKIYYDTLREGEIEALRLECLRVIRKDTQKTMLDDFFNFLYFCCMCCPDENEAQDLNEDVIEVTEILMNHSHLNKLFFHDVPEEDTEMISKAINQGCKYNYKEIDPYVLAAGFKRYCRDYFEFFLPKDVQITWLFVYRDQNHQKKTEITQRAPFVMGELHRIFFIQIFKLFKAISADYQKTETSMENLLDAFGSLLIKSPVPSTEFDGYTKKQILKDLLYGDFASVPREFFGK